MKKAVQACNFIKEILTHVFFCEYYEIFKNTYFEEHLWTAAFITSKGAFWTLPNNYDAAFYKK